MRFVLQIATGIVVGFVLVLALVVIAILLAIVGAVGVWLLSVAELAGFAVVAVAVLLFALAALTVSLFAAVPVQTFLHYYALLVLGDTNDAFDLIPEKRATVRE